MLPPPSQLQPVVADITEWLAMLAAGRVAEPPRAWSPTEWRYARVIAHIQGIAPLLHTRGVGQFGDDVWRTFLAQQHERNTLRNRRILALYEAIQHAAIQRAVPLLPLKGVALISWLYDDIGLRPMADIDLFTPPQHEPVAHEAIESAGFRLVDRMVRHNIFVLPPNTVVDLRGEHPDNPIKLELHTRLFDNIPRAEYDLTPWFTGYCRGVPASAPVMVDVLLHALLHATVHMMKRSLRFITVHDLALLCGRMTDADWHDLRDKLTALGGAWWAYPPLQLMVRYFQDALPDAFVAWLAKSTRPALRRAVPHMTMADVSFCNLRPQYLGELWVWSQNIGELAAYVAERLSGTGRMGWHTSHKWSKETNAFASKRGPYQRMLRWFDPTAYRAGVEDMLG